MSLIKIYKSKLFVNSLSEEQQTVLTDAFRAYKSGSPVPMFGRDVKYNHPNTIQSIKDEEVAHVHLAEDQETLIRWTEIVDPFWKTSDSCLVYAQGLNSQNYVLIAIWSPNAHDNANNPAVMRDIAEIAKQFRNRF